MIKKIWDIFFPEARVNVPGDIEDSDKILEIPVKRKKFTHPNTRKKRFETSDTDQDSVVKQAPINLSKRKFEVSDTDQESIIKPPSLSVSKIKSEASDTDQETSKKPIETKYKTQPFTIQEEKTTEKKFKESLTQTSSQNHRKFWEHPSGIFFDLPSTKRKMKSLEIKETDDLNTKFFKIFQLENLKNIYSGSQVLMPKQETFRRYDLDSNSFSENLSVVTDSFITPEDSPIISTSPASVKITPFILESPITKLQTDVSFKPLDLAAISQVSSPFFPGNQDSLPDIKSNVLFPVISSPFSDVPKQESSAKPNEDLPGNIKGSLFSGLNQGFLAGFKSEIIEKNKENPFGQAKENPVDRRELELSDASPKSQKMPEMQSMEIIASKENSILPDMELAGKSIEPEQVAPVPSTLVLQESSNNPFLNINHANIAKPAYVFGKGLSCPEVAPFISANPFSQPSFK